MNMEYAETLLVILVENSARILRAGFGVDRCSSAFRDIVELVEDYPSLRDLVVNSIQRTLANDDPSGLGDAEIPRELTEIISYKFKWPELKTMAEGRMISKFGGNRTMSKSDVADTMILAIDGAFPDKEYYEWIDKPD